MPSIGIGFGELLIIALVLIVAVGPESMPNFLRTVVKGFQGFKKTSRELQETIGINQLIRDISIDNALSPATKTPAFSIYEKRREWPESSADISHAIEISASRLSARNTEYPSMGPDVLHASR